MRLSKASLNCRKESSSKMFVGITWSVNIIWIVCPTSLLHEVYNNSSTITQLYTNSCKIIACYFWLIMVTLQLEKLKLVLLWLTVASGISTWDMLYSIVPSESKSSSRSSVVEGPAKTSLAHFFTDSPRLYVKRTLSLECSDTILTSLSVKLSSIKFVTVEARKDAQREHTHLILFSEFAVKNVRS